MHVNPTVYYRNAREEPTCEFVLWCSCPSIIGLRQRSILLWWFNWSRASSEARWERPPSFPSSTSPHLLITCWPREPKRLCISSPHYASSSYRRKSGGLDSLTSPLFRSEVENVKCLSWLEPLPPALQTKTGAEILTLRGQSGWYYYLPRTHGVRPQKRRCYATSSQPALLF